ncbi:hypothetical protein H4219_004673 [Mycoemilia scoparia]|uniref:Major facilitator superfamily (MFS) profile domain-containing protein n=1 Tax=Mycoemilia scoparia TaxID=417184 RepID=A0A9W8DQR7_9FUNG|nr:hypothetical protein H4219_004673 [Mycoemilia scoparia]
MTVDEASMISGTSSTNGNNKSDTRESNANVRVHHQRQVSETQEPLASKASSDTNDHDHEDEDRVNKRRQKILSQIMSDIGFGKYQKRILILCGLGWLADNMWMQGVISILPRVQRHFSISNSYIGVLMSSMFIGLMCGALFWGPLSDRLGRKFSFKCTLVISSAFGLISSLSPSFSFLCFGVFGIGFGVGGNMPVDGALFLEFIPKEKQNLLTFLSCFFSVGSIVSAGIAWGILPRYSCPDIVSASDDECDVSSQNRGWRYLLITLGCINLLMVLLRFKLVDLYETPRFLVQNKRQNDAVIVLRKIVRYNETSNGVVINNDLFHRRANTDHSDLELGNTGGPQIAVVPDEVVSPSSESSGSDQGWLDDVDRDRSNQTKRQKIKYILGAIRSIDLRSITLSGSVGFIKQKFFDGIQRLEPLFSPNLFLTTILVWAIWALVSLGFTMFNAFLPKILELHGNNGSSKADSSGPMNTSEVYRDAMIYAASGLPGSIIGTWLVDTFLGRKYSMVLSTFASSGFLFVFSKASSSVAIMISSSAFGLVSALMYAVIYAYTPEVFHAGVRGTGCGVASALSRIAGIIAPLITGPMVEWSLNGTLYTSMGILGVSGICMLLLPIETKGRAA